MTNNDKVVGWVGYDMLDAGKSLNECMKIIEADSILSSDTSLVDAIITFAQRKEPFFLVIKSNQFIGWISFDDLQKQPVCICMLALLLNLERTLLQIICLNPKKSLSSLSTGRRKKAEKIYADRKYNYNNGNVYYINLLQCTNMIDKFTIAQKTLESSMKLNLLKDQHNYLLAEKLRNELAHPKIEDRFSDLLTRETLWSLIKWAETLEQQLLNHLLFRRENKDYISSKTIIN